MSQQRITRYEEFWPFYLRQHALPRTRHIHLIGTLSATSCLVAAVSTHTPWFALAALLAGYGPAWLAHFFVEKNRPATFQYPLWSLLSDFQMAAFWLVGRLAAELEKAGIPATKGH